MSGIEVFAKWSLSFCGISAKMREVHINNKYAYIYIYI